MVDVVLFAFLFVVLELLVKPSEVLVAPNSLYQQVLIDLLLGFLLLILLKVNHQTIQVIQVDEFDLSYNNNYIKFLESLLVKFLIQVDSLRGSDSQNVEAVVVTQHDRQPTAWL